MTYAMSTVVTLTMGILQTITGAFALISVIGRLFSIDFSRPYFLLLDEYWAIANPMLEILQRALRRFAITLPQFDLLVLYFLLVGMANPDEMPRKFSAGNHFSASEAQAVLAC